jgi:hypothetical protein
MTGEGAEGEGASDSGQEDRPRPRGAPWARPPPDGATPCVEARGEAAPGPRPGGGDGDDGDAAEDAHLAGDAGADATGAGDARAVGGCPGGGGGSPALHPVTLRLSPPELEAAFWEGSPAIAILDRCGLVFGSTQMVRRHPPQENAPAAAAATATARAPAFVPAAQRCASLRPARRSAARCGAPTFSAAPARSGQWPAPSSPL